GNKIFNIDNIMLFNISTLIANKQYSPIFNTTFDLMSDTNIKTQMDAFVALGLDTRNNYLIDYLSLGIPLSTMEDIETYYDLYVENLPWSDGLSALLFYSIVATYDREEVVEDDRSFIEKVND